MSENLLFNGMTLIWVTNDNKSYKATSGMPGWQNPKFQKEKDKGPTPEGIYKVAVFYNGIAEIGNAQDCQLKPGWGIQKVPGQGAAVRYENGKERDCWDNYWHSWGPTRLQFDRVQGIENAAPDRSGFYLHNSQKGYSHGCIEVENSFFEDIGEYIKSKSTKIHSLRLRISYLSGEMITNGGTGDWTIADEREGQAYYNANPEARPQRRP